MCASETSSESRKSSRTSRILPATSKTATRRSCGRTKRRNSSRISERRLDSETMISIRRRSAEPTESSFESTWTEPEIDASGLRISCAMPAASSPTAASCSLNRRLALELLHLGQVLEDDERAVLAPRGPSERAASSRATRRESPRWSSISARYASRPARPVADLVPVVGEGPGRAPPAAGPWRGPGTMPRISPPGAGSGT